MNLKNIQRGIYAGLAGGLVFGLMMGMMGMLPMIGKMVGSPSASSGFLVHLAISATIGGSFAVLLDWAAHNVTGALSAGLGYGFVWWVLGPLTLMPLLLGMGFGVNWNASAATQALPSLLGHLAFGAILGGTYHWLEGRGQRELANNIEGAELA